MSKKYDGDGVMNEADELTEGRRDGHKYGNCDRRGRMSFK